MNTTLILIPTDFEAEQLKPLLPARSADGKIVLCRCGFGPVAAGCMTARLLSDVRPDRVVLTGIAGTLSTDLKVGTAHRFRRVGIYGIGSGTGAAFQTANEMGWPHITASETTEAIGDVIELAADFDPAMPADMPTAMLVTSCAASASSADAALRCQKFSEAIAEDMEGYSVAMACRLHDVPLEIVRGISNVAGDRNKDHWQVEQSLAAAATLLKETLL